MNILAKLAPQPMEIDLTLSQWDGQQFMEVPQVTVTICLPTWLEWQEVNASVDNPDMPMTRMEGGKKLPNQADPDYVEALNQARRDRQVRGVTFALLKGGNDIAGVTWETLRPGGGAIDLDELARAADALQDAAMSGFILGINAFMEATLGMGHKRKEAAPSADSFPPAQAGGDAHLLADGPDAEPVAEPA